MRVVIRAKMKSGETVLLRKDSIEEYIRWLDENEEAIAEMEMRTESVQE